MQIIIGGIMFDNPNIGLPRNPGALDIEWGYEHRIQEYKIPGYKDMTQVTSNEVLLKMTITIRTTDTGGVESPRSGGDGKSKFNALRELIKNPGPHVIRYADWPPIEMYLKNPKFRAQSGEDYWVGTWTLPFIEKYDG